MDQRLGGLWESIWDAVAETLTQTSPVLDGLRRTARMSHDLRDVFGFAPGTFIGKECQTVDVGVRSRLAEPGQHTRQQNLRPHHDTVHASVSVSDLS